MNPAQLQVLIGALTIIGAAITGYVGIKVALAEVRKDIKNLGIIIDKLDKRIDRLENPYFINRNRD
jgi:hypothetical protein